MTDDAELDRLDAEARYHRQRYDLYKAKVYSMRATSPARLRELQHACEAAEERLAHARAMRRAAADGEGRR